MPRLGASTGESIWRSPIQLVEVGRVGRTHGVDGELYVDQCALTPDELMNVGRIEWRGPDGKSRPLELTKVRPANDRLLVRFEGVVVREVATRLTNGTLWVDPAKLPDPGPGQAYTFQLIGLRVKHVDGRELGTVREIVSSDERMFYVVEGQDMLLPAYLPFVQNVDLAAGVITLDLPPGFVEP